MSYPGYPPQPGGAGGAAPYPPAAGAAPQGSPYPPAAGPGGPGEMGFVSMPAPGGGPYPPAAGGSPYPPAAAAPGGSPYPPAAAGGGYPPQQSVGPYPAAGGGGYPPAMPPGGGAGYPGYPDQHQHQHQHPQGHHGHQALAGQYQLSVACKKLKDLDVMSKSDPVCVLYRQVHNGWREVGRTEQVREDLPSHFLLSYKVLLRFNFAK